MEVSLFTCLPHVPPPEKLESCENNSFILVDSAPLVSGKENKLSASTSLENVKSKPIQDDDLFQHSSKNYCDNLILIHNNKEPHCETKMRVEAEDVVLDSAPVAAEVVSHVNGDISKEDAPYIFPLDVPASDISASINKVNLSPMEACVEDSNAASIDSAKKKKRYLFNFRPSLGKILVKTKNGESFKCYTCGGIYRQKFSLKRHFLRTHIDYRYISEADIANCKIPVPSYIAQHSNAENTANGRKKFKKSGDDVFLDNNDSGLLPGLYRCHDCTNVSFDSDAELREHYNKHPDSIKKKYECSICQASFIKKQILSRHLAGHEGKKIKLLCKKCNLEFSSKDELDKHLSIHSSGKTCRICEKVLSNVANRKRHEQLHLNSAKRCPRCGQCFAQRKELERHIKSQHSELSCSCSVCNQLCSSAESLALHMKEKHTSSPKLPDNTNASEPLPKPKPTRVCFVCKRVFPTVYAMLKHRRNAHPFHSRRKRHKKTAKAKSVISNRDSSTNEYKKTYIRPVGRPKGSGKKINVGDLRYVEKRERVFMKRAKKEEEEFLCNVHKNIAYNLTNCIEGRASQLSLKEYNFSDMQKLPEDFEERVNLPWEFYNFPSSYDVSNVLKVKGREIKRPENLSVADEFLHNATGLTPVNLSTSNSNQIKQSIDSINEISSNEYIYSKELNPEEKGKFIGKQIISVLVCHVCKERLDSHKAFTEHCINNHPNVECSYVEILGDKDFPPPVPPEMCKFIVSPVGFRFAYDVPPEFYTAPITCTKCRKTFRTVSELHEHIVICGNLNSKSKPRFKIPLSPKHSMRRRMTVAQFRFGFNNRSGTTPEKMRKQGFVKKITKSFCDKTPRTEKLLFYKNGRLQPKSFTVDKNYFATKPKPVKSGMSKRGRKSYEEKSLVYRYAGSQPSTSRECPHCRFVFASIQMLNNHIKSCSQQPVKKKNPAAASNSTSKNVSVSDSATINTTVKKIESESSSKSAVCNLSSLFNFQSSSSSAVSSEDLSFRSPKTSQNKSSFRKFSSVTESPNIPIDLSRNSGGNKRSTKTINLVNNRMTKSALELAMEAVQKHLTEVPDDEPILKLQQITEKIVVNKASAKSPLVSPVLKSGSGKKVGRPRKLKKETSTPIPVQKALIHSSPDKRSPSKPKKLEDIVKGIKENKVRVDENRLQKKACPEQTSENRLQKKACPEQTSVSDNKAVVISSFVSKIDQTVLPKSNQKAENKGLNKDIITNKNTQQSIPDKFNPFAADHNKSNQSADLKNKCSANSDINKVAPKIIELPAAKLPEKTQVLDVVCSEAAVINKPNVEAASSAGVEMPKIPQGIKVTKITLASPKLDMNVPEKTDVSIQDANSHGRSSPTSEFEGLLKSINQRLLSEDKNQQDDSAIPWLEDEKFEIPPSRTPLNVIVNSNAEKTSVNTGTTIIPSIVSAPNNKLNEEQPTSLAGGQVLPSIPQGLQIKSLTISNKEQNKGTFINNKVSQPMEQKAIKEKITKEILNKPIFDNVVLAKGTKIQHADKNVLTGQKSPSSLNNKSPSVLKTAKSEFKPSHRRSLSDTVKSSTTKLEQKIDTVKSSTTTLEQKIDTKIAKPTVNASEKRRPGRPRKKQIEVYAESSNVTKTHSSAETAKTAESNSVRNSVSAEANASVKSSDASLQKLVPDVSRSEVKKNSLASSLESVPLTMGTSVTQSSVNVTESDKSVNQVPNESETSESLKNFCLKSKTVLDNENDKDNLKALFKSTTTEFGKNLASKMKEKMRLSLEHDLPKTTLSTDDANNSNCGSENSETNSLVSTDEKLIKVIKKECETAENQKIHFCPYCMLEFAYLTNFRRHIKQCKARDQAKEMEPAPGTQTNLQHLPKKDEVDYSILNLYRYQSRQTDRLKEDENANKHITTYECTDCHKIYLNLFNLIQHKLSTHKLVEQSNPGCSSEINEMNILSLAGHLTPESSPPENDSSFIHESIGLNALSNILENYQKPAEAQSSGSIDDHDKAESSKTESLSKKLEDQPVKKAEYEVLKSVDKDVKLAKQSDSVNIHAEKLENKNNPGVETAVKEKAKADSSSNDNNANLKTNSSNESPSTKKKRGRPVGWRKNPDAVKESAAKNNKIRAENKKEKSLLKKSLLMLKKKGEMRHSNAKLKNATKRLIIDNMKKVIAKKKSKNLPNEEKSTVELTSVKDIPNEKANLNTPVGKLLVPEEEIKNVPKRSSPKTTTESEKVPDSSKDVSKASPDFKENNTVKNSSVKNPLKLSEKSSIKTEARLDIKQNNIAKHSSVKNSLKLSEKSLIKTEASSDSKESNITKPSSVKNSMKLSEKSTEASLDVKESSVKRSRGRPPWKNVVMHTRKIVSKSEALQKRKPGRPPKNSFSSSNPPQTVKIGIASSSSAKNPKRAPAPMQMYPLHVDNSSDSDSKDAKTELSSKKKINLKCCALCSDKFVSSLELKRHIQLKHNKKKSDDNKSELQRKILKGLDSRSSSLDAPECEKDILVKRCDNPQRKPNQMTPSRKPDPGKSNRTAQVRKAEPNLKPAQASNSLSKSPSSDAIKSEKDISPKRSETPIKRSDTPPQRSDTPPQRSDTPPAPKHLKICAICKQKFPTGPLLYQHLQMFHNRKSLPVAIVPDKSSSPGRKSQPAAIKSSPSSASSSPVRKKKELNFDRKSLSRQCRKPLPPLKRQRIIKKEPLEQIPKKSKL